MILLFILLTTLAITIVIDSDNADTTVELIQSTFGLLSAEWIMVPVLMILLTSIAYVLYLLNEKLNTRNV